MLRSLAIAFSMYSKIPMPQFEWKDKNLKYSLCFFPLIGVVIGACVLGFGWIAEKTQLPLMFRAIVFTVLPVVITGGIHMDGYCDTVDALASYQSREKRLEILKDPHIGAFACIRCGIYYLLQVGVFCLLSEKDYADGTFFVMIGMVYVISRALSGLAGITFRNAKKEGSLFQFTSAAHKGVVLCSLIGFLAAANLILIMLSWITGILMCLAEGGFFFYYYVMSKRKFGGITGDLEGWFLQCMELLLLYVCIGIHFVGV